MDHDLTTKAGRYKALDEAVEQIGSVFSAAERNHPPREGPWTPKEVLMYLGGAVDLVEQVLRRFNPEETLDQDVRQHFDHCFHLIRGLRSTWLKIPTEKVVVPDLPPNPDVVTFTKSRLFDELSWPVCEKFMELCRNSPDVDHRRLPAYHPHSTTGMLQTAIRAVVLPGDKSPNVPTEVTKGKAGTGSLPPVAWRMVREIMQWVVRNTSIPSEKLPAVREAVTTAACVYWPKDEGVEALVNSPGE